MKQKWIALALALCMLLSVMTACGGTAAYTSESEVDAPEEVASAPETSETPAEAPAAPEAETSAEEPAEPVMEDTFKEGAGVFPIADGDETITIWDGWFPFFSAFFADYSETTFFQTMEERTGVKTEFTLVNAEQAAEMFNLMVATGDYRDLMHDVDTNYVGGLDTAWEEDVIIAIDDLIDDWMPNYKAELLSEDGFIADLTSNEGNIYQFSIIRHEAPLPDYGLIIRQDWLDELNMDRPETYDEYHDVLTAFKNDLGASAPMMLSNAGSYQGNFFASGYGVNASLVNGGQPFYQVDGEVKYGPIEDGYRKYLETISTWYTEGLIYQDFYTHTESNTMPPDDLVVNDQMGLFGANIQDIPTRYNSVVGDNSTLHLVGAYDPVENKGDTNHFSQSASVEAGGGYCVSTHCENTELVARWADYIYSPEGQILSNYGVEGETFEYVDGEPKLSDLVLNNPDMPQMLAITKYTTYDLVGVQDEYRMYSEFTDDQWEAGEIWAMGDDAYTLPRGAEMTSDESALFYASYGDINTYVAETTLSVILGDTDINEIWDEFVANIQNMGIANCIEQEQAALDRYYGA